MNEVIITIYSGYSEAFPIEADQRMGAKPILQVVSTNTSNVIILAVEEELRLALDDP